MKLTSRRLQYVSYGIIGAAVCVAGLSLSGQTPAPAAKAPASKKATAPASTAPAKAAPAKTAATARLYSPENRLWPARVQKMPADQKAFSPADAMKTFYMPPGWRIELIAAEPLLQDPILMEFDGDGRLWVLEMQGFAVDDTMRDDRGPICDLVVLEDTNDDGVMDKRTVFLDKLSMPRAFKVLEGNAALVGESPNLILARDTNGDLKADTREIIRTDYGGGNVEHDANGLFWAMDNILYNSEFTYHLRPKDGKFEMIRTVSRGQWGLTQDDAGRVYRDVNTDALFIDYVPDRYFMRNPNAVGTKGLYESLVNQEETQVWPVRDTVGVNRGYRDTVLRPDGSAYYYQGVSSPLIYRGDRLPKDVQGDAFVVDGPTNLVHRLVIKDDGTGRLTAHDAYKKGEFLASTDERFRPVALAGGPDGSFYIVDMYRGVSQDGPIQTDFLRDYINARHLQTPINIGRIYRVVHDTTKFDKKPQMSKETPAQIVAHLSHPNGWWRDTAQQILVQRGDKSVVPALKQLAGTSLNYRAKLHALWTLDGLDSLDAATVTKALGDVSPFVRASAIRLSEHWLGEAGNPIQAAVLKKMNDTTWTVRRQLAASLGELPKADKVAPITEILTRYGSDPITVDAAISGLNGQEGEVLDKVLATPAKADANVLTMLSGAVGKSRNVPGVDHIISMATETTRAMPQRVALLRGIETGLGGGGGRGGAQVVGGRAGTGIPGLTGGGGRGRGGLAQGFALAAEPKALTALGAGTGELADAAKAVMGRVSWPGKPVVAVTQQPRTPEEQARYNTGQGIYTSSCAGCHGANGEGTPGVGAALSGSRWVTGGTAVLERILMNGKEGPIGLMPPLGGSMNDDQVAAVLTYIRGSFGNTGTAVNPLEVKETRLMYSYRKTPWSETELAPAGRGGGGGRGGGRGGSGGRGAGN